MKKVTKTEYEPELSETTGTSIPEVLTVAKLDVSFQSEDLNKVVDKINELIEKYNGTL